MSFQRCQRQQISSSAGNLYNPSRIVKNKYMMAENYVYTKPNILIRELAKQGLFGDIYFGEGQYIHELKAFNEITKWRQ